MARSGNVHITRSLDPTFGLDQEAIKTVKKWRFAPGTRFGQPVPVLVDDRDDVHAALIAQAGRPLERGPKGDFPRARTAW